MKVDYLIIGAGLAGTTCAFLLKRADKNVLVVDRADLASKSKLCGGLVTPRSAQLLTSIFGLECVSLFKSKFSEMLCRAGDCSVLVKDIDMHSVERSELDSFVLEQYRKLGGAVIDRFSIKNLDTISRNLTGIENGALLHSIEYEKLIVADGALSTVRELLTGKKPSSILSLEGECTHNGSPLVMSYDSGTFGYSWYAPCGNKAKIGCCSYDSSTDLKKMLSSFSGYIGIEPSNVRGAFIPTGQDVLLQTKDAFFLGDAASLICPPSGEGIFYALKSAEVLSRALLEGLSYSALMSPYTARIQREYLTRNIFYNDSFINYGLRLAQSTPYGSERAVKFALNHFVSFR